MIFDDLLRDVETKTGSALALFGGEVGIENLRHLLGANAAAVILDLNVDVEIFLRATNRDRSFFLSRSLNGVDEDILDGARYLDRIALTMCRDHHKFRSLTARRFVSPLPSTPLTISRTIAETEIGLCGAASTLP